MEDPAAAVGDATLDVGSDLPATATTLIVAHHLWERSDRPEDREQVVLFNLATLATILVGVLTLYLVLMRRVRDGSWPRTALAPSDLTRARISV